jgi:hypothetical protein
MAFRLDNVIETFAAQRRGTNLPRQRNVFRALLSTLQLVAKENEGALTETAKLIPAPGRDAAAKRPRTFN